MPEFHITAEPSQIPTDSLHKTTRYFDTAVYPLRRVASQVTLFERFDSDENRSMNISFQSGSSDRVSETDTWGDWKKEITYSAALPLSDVLKDGSDTSLLSAVEPLVQFTAPDVVKSLKKGNIKHLQKQNPELVTAVSEAVAKISDLVELPEGIVKQIDRKYLDQFRAGMAQMIVQGIAENWIITSDLKKTEKETHPSIEVGLAQEKSILEIDEELRDYQMRLSEARAVKGIIVPDDKQILGEARIIMIMSPSEALLVRLVENTTGPKTADFIFRLYQMQLHRDNRGPDFSYWEIIPAETESQALAEFSFNVFTEGRRKAGQAKTTIDQLGLALHAEDVELAMIKLRDVCLLSEYQLKREPPFKPGPTQ